MVLWNDALVGPMDLFGVLFRGRARKRNLDAARAASRRLRTGTVQVVRGVLGSQLEPWVLHSLDSFFVHRNEPIKGLQMSLG